ncbi:MAG: hypothetical protein ACR2LE_08945 [Nocardioidaceae bacterium]
MLELYHLGVATSTVPRLAVLLDPLLPSRPAVEVMTGRPLASRREYVSHLGAWDGHEVLLTTVGIGAPPLAIAVEELARSGVKAFLLLGTATFSDAVTSSTLLPHGAVRGDGTSAQYAPLPFPAVPDPLLRARLASAAGNAASYGLVESVDVEDGRLPPAAHVVARDLRCAALFVTAAARGVRAAALLIDPDRVDATRGGVDPYEVGDMAVAAYRALSSTQTSEGEGT